MHVSSNECHGLCAGAKKTGCGQPGLPMPAIPSSEMRQGGCTSCGEEASQNGGCWGSFFRSWSSIFPLTNPTLEPNGWLAGPLDGSLALALMAEKRTEVRHALKVFSKRWPIHRITSLIWLSTSTTMSAHSVRRSAPPS